MKYKYSIIDNESGDVFGASKMNDFYKTVIVKLDHKVTFQSESILTFEYVSEVNYTDTLLEITSHPPAKGKGNRTIWIERRCVVYVETIE